jgi:DNA-binding HxlR family transcriptional regulator
MSEVTVLTSLEQLTAMEHIVRDIHNVVGDRYQMHGDHLLILARLPDDGVVIGKLGDDVYFGTNASYSLDRLAERGLIERKADLNDRRRTWVTPTTKGRKMREELHALIDKTMPVLVRRYKLTDTSAVVETWNGRGIPPAELPDEYR